MNRSRIIAGVVGTVIVAFVLLAFVSLYNRSTAVAQTVPVRQVTDVPYNKAIPVTRTLLCLDGQWEMRDWNFQDRWIKPQLTQDEYFVDGVVYRSLRIVTDDRSLPPGNVRFRKVRTNVGTGPVVEGHSYLRTLIDGNPVTVEREVLLVEFNGMLERQRRPLQACGTPRQ